MTDAAITNTEYKYEWDLNSRARSLFEGFAELDKQIAAVEARKALGGIPYAPTPTTTKAEYQAIAEEILESNDYWRLADWYSYTCRRFADELPLADVLIRSPWFRRIKCKSMGVNNVYWILNGDRCVYVGYCAWGARTGIQRHIHKRTPLGRYLRGLKSYDGLRCGFVRIYAGGKTGTRKFGRACRDLEIEKRDPVLNERL